VVREAFVSAQFVSFYLKDVRASKIVLDFSKEYNKVHLGSTLMRIVAKMLTRLSILWDFRQHGHLYGTKIAKDVVHVLSIRDRVFLMLNKHKDQLHHICALGVLWNDFVRSLALNVFQSCVEARESMIDSDWHFIMERGFAEINDENLMRVEGEMKEEGLEAFLTRYQERFRDGSLMTPLSTPLTSYKSTTRPPSRSSLSRPPSRSSVQKSSSRPPSRSGASTANSISGSSGSSSQALDDSTDGSRRAVTPDL
tara:strand:- start:1690 stop:2448 length:759 start_codon:yes stop_codon:yes gene_type:complete